MNGFMTSGLIGMIVVNMYVKFVIVTEIEIGIKDEPIKRTLQKILITLINN